MKNLGDSSGSSAGDANLLAAVLARDVGRCAKHQIESTSERQDEHVRLLATPHRRSLSKVLLTFEEEENFPPLVRHPFLNFPSLSSLSPAHFLAFPVIWLRGRCLGVTGRIKHH